MINFDNTSLGIEFGSTRIKAVLIDENYKTIASGSFDWQNKLVDGIWTYSLEAVQNGLRESYRRLAESVYKTYGTELTKVGAIGISAMMHGYLVLDEDGSQLVPFRTWRNTITAESADKLTELFGFNIPQRWSIAHLYQAILNKEPHITKIKRMTTLSGYVHSLLTGRNVLGIGDASGMFPIENKGYNQKMLAQFDGLVKDSGCKWKLREILPEILPAGAFAGNLTESGAKLLDPSGKLRAGIPFCPPEGDAATGMAATNSVAVGTGNVSAGTSIFAMAVLPENISHCYREIDIINTPEGYPVAMVHCNSCTSDIDAWIGIFRGLLESVGASVAKSQLYDVFYDSAAAGAPDCGGVVTHNFYAGEPIADLPNARPLVYRTPEAEFTLQNFARSLVYSSFAMLKYGMDILLKKENITVERLYAHGGLFKTPVVAQSMLASALNIPVSVMSSAGEGGPWGMAVLAGYMRSGAGESLGDYLAKKVFASAEVTSISPNEADRNGFERYMQSYMAGVQVQKNAVWGNK